MNPLESYPRIRKAAYITQFIVAGLVLLTGIGYGAAGVELPTWYVVVAAVTSGAWSYLGLTAASNTYVPQHRRDEGRPVL